MIQTGYEQLSFIQIQESTLNALKYTPRLLKNIPGILYDKISNKTSLK